MPEREKLAAGLGCAAWGYFLLLFNFEINGFNLLPEFLGYALFFWALEHFAGTGRSDRSYAFHATRKVGFFGEPRRETARHESGRHRTRRG